MSAATPFASALPGRVRRSNAAAELAQLALDRFAATGRAAGLQLGRRLAPARPRPVRARPARPGRGRRALSPRAASMRAPISSAPAAARQRALGGGGGVAGLERDRGDGAPPDRGRTRRKRYLPASSGPGSRCVARHPMRPSARQQRVITSSQLARHAPGMRGSSSPPQRRPAPRAPARGRRPRAARTRARRPPRRPPELSSEAVREARPPPRWPAAAVLRLARPRSAAKPRLSRLQRERHGRCRRAARTPRRRRAARPPRSGVRWS